MLIDILKRNNSILDKTSAKYINSVREKAFRSFSELGIPTRKNENYKYTDLDRVFSKKYNFHFGPKNIDFNINDIFKCDIPELDTQLKISLI